MVVWPASAVAKTDIDDVKEWRFLGKRLQIVFHEKPDFVKTVFCVVSRDQRLVSAAIGVRDPLCQAVLAVCRP